MPKKSNKKGKSGKTKAQISKERSERMKALHAKKKQEQSQKATVEVAKAVKATADATKTLAENIKPKKTKQSKITNFMKQGPTKKYTAPKTTAPKQTKTTQKKITDYMKKKINKPDRVILHNFLNEAKPIQKIKTLPFLKRYLEGLRNIITEDEKKKPAFEVFSYNGTSNFVRLTPRMTISHMITWIGNYYQNLKNAKAAIKGRTKTTGTKRVSKTGTKRVSKTGKPLGRPKGSKNKAGHKAGRPKGSGKKK